MPELLTTDAQVLYKEHSYKPGAGDWFVWHYIQIEIVPDGASLHVCCERTLWYYIPRDVSDCHLKRSRITRVVPLSEMIANR